MFERNFMGYYINDYNEVLQTPTPLNGTPVLFANLNAGMLYSKKNINRYSSNSTL